MEEAAASGGEAGCDLDCGKAYGALLIAEGKGLIGEAEIDVAVNGCSRRGSKLGMFDPAERVPLREDSV